MLLSGPLDAVALAVKAATESGSPNAVLVFDDTTGRVVDLDLRGTAAEVVERLSRPPSNQPVAPNNDGNTKDGSARDGVTEARGRGRPRLGVVAREVTLLPKQWEWLAAQPGGASAVLRRLVDDARRSGGLERARRTAQEAAYHFMLAIAGDLPGYEEATRALFANDRRGLEHCIAHWPHDIRAHALRLAFGAPDGRRL